MLTLALLGFPVQSLLSKEVVLTPHTGNLGGIGIEIGRLKAAHVVT
jgi:hypothetical protein